MDYLPKTSALSRDTGAVEVVSVSLGRFRQGRPLATVGGRRYKLWRMIIFLSR